MKSDYEIAQETPLRPITSIATDMGLPADMLIPFGYHKAKINIKEFDEKKIASSKPVSYTHLTLPTIYSV